MKYFKSFMQFLTEGETKVVKVAGKEHESPNDKKLEKEVEKYMDKVDDDCPRCGEAPEDCKCEGDDQWSSHTIHRVPPEERQKNEPNQKFKNED